MFLIFQEALSSPDAMLRCAGGEALGRLSQVIGEPAFVAQVVQMSVDSFKKGRDINIKTGHILSLGCLHRYVGGMGSGKHLHQSVSVLQELATDSTSTTGQVMLSCGAGNDIIIVHLVLIIIIQFPF